MQEERCISRIKIDDTVYEVKDEYVRYLLSDICEEESNEEDSSSERE